MSKIIAIGALGGSGTRTVAQILIDAGVYMGDFLNKSNDNVLFARLFKNPKWYIHGNTDNLNRRLKIFKNYMEDDSMSLSDVIEIFKASQENPYFGFDYHFVLRILSKFFKSKKHLTTWGWKEPNTQIYIREINNFSPQIKYIHVLRHGLDMAFSNNITQLKNWGFKFNLFLQGNENKNEIACKQLDYWILSTKHVLKTSESLGDRFYLLKHNDLYENSKTEVNKLLDFVGLDVTTNQKQILYSIPQKPNSAERFKNYNLDIFRKDQIDFVKSMGFEI